MNPWFIWLFLIPAAFTLVLDISSLMANKMKMRAERAGRLLARRSNRVGGLRQALFHRKTVATLPEKTPLSPFGPPDPQPSVKYTPNSFNEYDDLQSVQDSGPFELTVNPPAPVSPPGFGPVQEYPIALPPSSPVISESQDYDVSSFHPSFTPETYDNNYMYEYLKQLGLIRMKEPSDAQNVTDDRIESSAPLPYLNLPLQQLYDPFSAHTFANSGSGGFNSGPNKLEDNIQLLAVDAPPLQLLGQLGMPCGGRACNQGLGFPSFGNAFGGGQLGFGAQPQLPLLPFGQSFAPPPPSFPSQYPVRNSQCCRRRRRRRCRFRVRRRRSC